MQVLQTAAQQVEVFNKVKDSKFWGNIDHVQTRKQAQKFIAQIKEKYNDASHNVSAYVIGMGEEPLTYCDDDGEPSGSSGSPVLQAIEGADLANTVIVITRYFGGTELGIGGLIRAYGDTARLAIEKSGIQKLKPAYRMQVEIEYNLLGTALGQIESAQAKIKDVEYDESGAQISFLITEAKKDKLLATLNEVCGGKIELRQEELFYHK